MDISVETKMEYRLNIEKKTFTTKEAFSHILEKWTVDQGVKATVEKLVVFMETAGFGDVGRKHLTNFNRNQLFKTFKLF